MTVKVASDRMTKTIPVMIVEVAANPTRRDQSSDRLTVYLTS